MTSETSAGKGGEVTLPLKTRATQRHWSSESGMMPPRGWMSPIAHNVACLLRGGNTNL